MSVAAVSASENVTEDVVCQSGDDAIAVENDISDTLEAPKNIKVSSNVSYDTVVSGKYFYVKFTDENQKPVVKKPVYFIFNGTVNKTSTSSGGIAKYLMNQTKGKYSLTYVFNETGYVPVKKTVSVMVVTTKKAKISAQDYTAYVGFKNYFKVKLTLDGLPLAKEKVTITINGRDYTKTTNSKGEASQEIGLKKGTYKVIVKYEGRGVVKKATGKYKITVKKQMPTKIARLTKGYFREKTLSHYNVSLKDARGSPMKNKKIIFKINGVKYVKKTDKNGIATLDVKLKKGVYKISYKYRGDDVYKKSESTRTLKIKPNYTRNNGFWLWGSHMKEANLKYLAKMGTKQIFLNAKAVSLHGKSEVLKFIAEANNNGIKVHLWMQVFCNDGKWVSPVYKNGTYNMKIINSKVQLAKTYASYKGVAGVHFDYLRFPGNAYDHKNGVKAINYFTKKASNAIHSVNSKLVVSAAIMPEPSSLKYYYGQDIPTISKYLDVMVPMVYKGNYNAGTNWIKYVTGILIKQSNGAKVWTGLQTYRSDADTSKLSPTELMNDADAAALAGARGVILFRYGLVNMINFNDV